MPYQSGNNNTRANDDHFVWDAQVSERVLDSIPGVLVWVAFLVCIISAMTFPRTILLIAAVLGLYSSLRFAIAGIANFIGLYRIRRWARRDWRAYYDDHADTEVLAWDTVHHLVIIPNYNEPLTVLRRTLNGLAGQSEAERNMTVVLAMEAGEADSAAKGETLLSDYADTFANIFYTVHPKDLQGEMQCKSANEAWAGRWAKRKLVNEMGYDLDTICVTTMDADTQWHPQHFAALTAHFALHPQRYERFWQAPIRYHGQIWSVNPLLRIVNAYATAMELAYLAAPWWKVLPMSSYALSLRLLDESDYWDGDVIADEWHMFIKAYFAAEGQVETERIMLPFIADVTHGDSLFEQLRERYLQTLRHAWGSKEVGYMIAQMIEHPKLNDWRSFRLLGRISHDVLMAGAGWVILTAGSQLPILLHPEVAPIDLSTLLRDPQQAFADATVVITAEPTWILLGIAGLLVVVLGVLFWFQDVIVRPAREPHQQQTMPERLWTLLSFPLLPVLTLVVLAIPVIQAQTRLLLGLPLQFRVTKKA